MDSKFEKEKSTLNKGQRPLMGIQTEKGEFITSPFGDIVDSAADRLHKNEENGTVTDITAGGNYVISNADSMKFDKKELEDLILDKTASVYKEGQSNKAPEDILYVDLAPRKSKFTPAEYIKNVRKKFPITARLNDAFAKQAIEKNKAARIPYIETTAELSEIKKPMSKDKFARGGMVGKLYDDATIDGVYNQDHFLKADNAMLKASGYTGVNPNFKLPSFKEGGEIPQYVAGGMIASLIPMALGNSLPGMALKAGKFGMNMLNKGMNAAGSLLQTGLQNGMQAQQESMATQEEMAQLKEGGEVPKYFTGAEVPLLMAAAGALGNKKGAMQSNAMNLAGTAVQAPLMIGANIGAGLYNMAASENDIYEDLNLDSARQASRTAHQQGAQREFGTARNQAANQIGQMNTAFKQASSNPAQRMHALATNMRSSNNLMSQAYNRGNQLLTQGDLQDANYLSQMAQNKQQTAHMNAQRSDTLRGAGMQQFIQAPQTAASLVGNLFNQVGQTASNAANANAALLGQAMGAYSTMEKGPDTQVAVNTGDGGAYNFTNVDEGLTTTHDTPNFSTPAMAPEGINTLTPPLRGTGLPYLRPSAAGNVIDLGGVGGQTHNLPDGSYVTVGDPNAPTTPPVQEQVTQAQEVLNNPPTTVAETPSSSIGVTPKPKATESVVEEKPDYSSLAPWLQGEQEYNVPSYNGPNLVAPEDVTGSSAITTKPSTKGYSNQPITRDYQVSDSGRYSNMNIPGSSQEQIVKQATELAANPQVEWKSKISELEAVIAEESGKSKPNHTRVGSAKKEIKKLQKKLTNAQLQAVKDRNRANAEYFNRHK